MELNDFIEKLAVELDEENSSDMNKLTEVKSMENWSSATALCVIAMIDAEYGVQITGQDIRAATTIEDLFKIVKALKG